MPRPSISGWFDSRIRIWRPTVTKDALQAEKRIYAVSSVVECAINRSLSTNALQDGGNATVGTIRWYGLASIDVKPRDLAEIVSGPDAGTTWEVDAVKVRPRAHHTQVDCFEWNGKLPEVATDSSDDAIDSGDDAGNGDGDGDGLTPTHLVLTVGNHFPVVGFSLTVFARLRDADEQNVPLAGRVVTWSKTGAGGSFAFETSVTDNNGLASVIFTVSGSVETYTFTGTDSEGLTGTSDEITSIESSGDILDFFPEIASHIASDGKSPIIRASLPFTDAQVSAIDDVGTAWTGIPIPPGYHPSDQSSVEIASDGTDPISPPAVFRKKQLLPWSPGGVSHDFLALEPISAEGAMVDFWIGLTLKINKPFIGPASNGQKIFAWWESNPNDPDHIGLGWVTLKWLGGPLGAANGIPVLADDGLRLQIAPEYPAELDDFLVNAGDGGSITDVATDVWIRIAIGLKASSIYGVADGRLIGYINGVKNIDAPWKSTAGRFIKFDLQCMFGGDFGSLQDHYDHLIEQAGFEDVVAEDNVYEYGHVVIVEAA